MEVLRAFVSRLWAPIWGLWVRVYWHPPNDYKKLNLRGVVADLGPVEHHGSLWARKKFVGFTIARDPRIFEDITALRYYHPELTCLDAMETK